MSRSLQRSDGLNHKYMKSENVRVPLSIRITDKWQLIRRIARLFGKKQSPRDYPPSVYFIIASGA